MRLTYLGEISAEDILQHTLQEHEHPQFQPGMHSLSDFSHAKFINISYNVVHKYNAHMPAIEKVRGTCRWAMASENLFNYGILRMFSLLNGDSPIQMKVFRDVSEARSWLDEYERKNAS